MTWFLDRLITDVDIHASKVPVYGHIHSQQYYIYSSQLRMGDPVKQNVFTRDISSYISATIELNIALFFCLGFGR